MSRGPKSRPSSSKSGPPRPSSDFEETTPRKAASAPEPLRSTGGDDPVEETETVTMKGRVLDKTQRMQAVELPRIASKTEEVTSTVPLNTGPLSTRSIATPSSRTSAAPPTSVRTVPPKGPVGTADLNRRLKLLWASLFVVVAMTIVLLGIMVRTVRDLREDSARRRAAAAARGTPTAPRTVSAISVDDTPSTSASAVEVADASAPASAAANAAIEADAGPVKTNAIADASITMSSPDAGTASEADTGVVVPVHNIYSRRVWIDGRLAGQTPEHFTVKCGKHKVKVGSDGEVATVDVPCGGAITMK